MATVHGLGPDESRVKRHALIWAALAAALVGLTVLDVAPSRLAQRAGHDDSHSVDCIVASALFAGVDASLPSTPLQDGTDGAAME